MAKLTMAQAEELEAKMRAIEADPELGKRAMRLFMQDRMPCGHWMSALLTCPDPPFGCVDCGEPEEARRRFFTKNWVLGQIAKHGFVEVLGPVRRMLDQLWLDEHELRTAMCWGANGTGSDLFVVYRKVDHAST